MIDSHSIVRSNTERFHVLFIQFSPIVMSCSTTVRYHNQGIDFDTVDTEHFHHYKDFLGCPFITTFSASTPPLETTSLPSISTIL